MVPWAQRAGNKMRGICGRTGTLCTRGTKPLTEKFLTSEPQMSLKSFEEQSHLSNNVQERV